MLDIGWPELLVIAIILIVVVGPKDLPPMLRAFGKMTQRLKGMAGDFRQQFDDALREADMDDVRKTISDAQKLNPVNSLKEAMNPLRQMGNEIRNDLQNVVKSEPATAADEEPLDFSVPDPSFNLPDEPPVVAEPQAEAAPAKPARKPRASKASKTAARSSKTETTAAKRAPAAKKAAPRRAAAKSADAAVSEAKPAARKPAASKSAPKKPAAKKPAVSKAASAEKKTVKKTTTRAKKTAAADKTSDA